jgi:hypothetical protein
MTTPPQLLPTLDEERSYSSSSSNHPPADVRCSRRLTTLEKRFMQRIKTRSKDDIQKGAFAELLALRQKNTGHSLTKDIHHIVSTYKNANNNSFVTRDNLFYRYSKYQKGCYDGLLLTNPIVTGNPPIIDLLPSPPIPQIHAPENTNGIALEETTIVNKDNNGNKKSSKSSTDKMTKRKIAELTTEAATLLKAERIRSKGLVLAKGTLAKIIQNLEDDAGLKEGSINPKTVMTRVRTNNLTGYTKQHVSPLDKIEPLLVQWCVMLSQIGESLTKQKVINLAKDMIQNTEHAIYLNDYKKKRRLDICDNNAPGEGWYRGFMERHSDMIKKSKLYITDVNRKSYVTKDNFKRMYQNVYEYMVACGVAKKLDHEVMLDKDGNITFDKNEMVGLPTKYIMKNPRNLVFVDEVGVNTNQKTDGYVGGELHIVPSNNTGCGKTGTVTDLRFTTLGFTSGTGEPVMCAVIFKSEKDISKIPINWKTGIDITKQLFDGKDSYDVIRNNSQPGGAMCGGPVCTFKGIQVPCFMGTSPNASITGELLTEMLAFMDARKLFERDTGNSPFLLLDGHHSRLNLSFLEYISNPDHLWRVCIGVPYGTHVWQVADSSELNGAFKIAMTKAKREYLLHKHSSQQSFCPTDLMPLLCQAWNNSFGKYKNGEKAIKERGWGPLNYRLLLNPIFNTAIENSEAILASEPPESEKPTQINISGSSEYFFHKLLDAYSKNEGVRAAYREKENVQDDTNRKYKSIKELTRISSGTLTANNHHCLNNEDLLECIRSKSNMDNKKVSEKKERHDDKMKQQQARFEKAFATYANDKSKLTIADYRSLLVHYLQPGEGPIKPNSTKSQLHDQWMQIEHRARRVIDIASLAVPNNNNNAGASSYVENRTMNTTGTTGSSGSYNTNNLGILGEAALLSITRDSNSYGTMGSSITAHTRTHTNILYDGAGAFDDDAQDEPVRISV